MNICQSAGTLPVHNFADYCVPTFLNTNYESAEEKWHGIK